MAFEAREIKNKVDQMCCILYVLFVKYRLFKLKHITFEARTIQN